MFVLVLFSIIAIYLYFSKNKQHNKQITEHFIALNGITKPLTTISDDSTKSLTTISDDSTKSFIRPSLAAYNFNDLPLYDSTYNDMAYVRSNTNRCNTNSTYVADCQIKRLIPHNYVDYEKTASINLIDKQNTTVAPLPLNYFY